MNVRLHRAAAPLVLGVCCATTLLLTPHAAIAQSDETPAPTPLPHIEFESETGFDFGRILDTEHQSASFVFKNNGTAPLRILSVTSTCGCTEPEIDGITMPSKKGSPIDGAIYQPGEGSTIRIKFNPLGKSGDNTQTVTIMTNDPSRPKIELPVKAFVQPVVSLDPVALSVGQLERISESEWTVNIISTDIPDKEVPFAVERASVTGQPDFHVTVGDRTRINTEFGEAWNQALILRYTGGAQARHVRGSIVIRTNDESRWLLSIPFEGDVLGDLRANTKSIRLGNNIELGSDLTKSVVVFHPEGKAFGIKAVLDGTSRRPLAFSTSPADTEETPKGIDISMPFPTSRPGPVRGKVLVVTDLPGEPPIEVSYFGNIAIPERKPVETGPVGPQTGENK
ncbi:MAG: DUF1573 domain-containing protein [Phycisphaeraceae bacterium]|nr:DUF1573 domain-containing protein [Phycisphaerales bacterium]MCB9860979.1 DUF1573 domain-containing protein [Phycisphaeraceae bacterium]